LSESKFFDRFTDHAKQSLNRARDEVLRLGHAQLGSQHIFRSLVESGVASQALRMVGHDLPALQSAIELDGVAPASQDELELRSRASRPMPFSDDAKRLLERSMKEASELGHNYIGTEHLLLASLFVEPVASGLAAQRIERGAVQAAVLACLEEDADEDDCEEYRVHSLFSAGRSLSADDAARLLAQVEKDPDDVDSRLKLVGHFHRRFTERGSGTAHLALVEWLVSRHPDAYWAGSPELEIHELLDPHGFASVRALWLRQVDAHPTSGRVRANAATFLVQDDHAKAVRLLEEAKALEPDVAEWPRRLGQIHRLQLMSLDGEERRTVAKLALAEHERAIALTNDELEIYAELGDLGALALDAGEEEKAEGFAKRLLAMNEALEENWNTGNAVHKGNLILGRLALRAGDIETAKVKLREAGKTDGSPQLDSFGPNMSLAKELIELGERDVVLEYFELCRRFWTGDRHESELDKWSAVVAAGGMPQFGANLHY
jgi:tetratricopeptide (TPR) repeat protein